MRVSRRVGNLTICLATLVSLTGCGQQIGALLYISGAYKETTPTQVEMEPGSQLAMLVDYANPDQVNPIFARTLQSRFERLLTEQKVDVRVVPFGDVVRARSREADFDKWPISRVGRQMNADYVMYVRVTSLRLQRTPDVPLLEPSVSARMKVIAVDAPDSSARLWPEGEKDGKLFEVNRAAREFSHPDEVDHEATRLARELAWHLSRPFHKHDPEDKPPLE